MTEKLIVPKESIEQINTCIKDLHILMEQCGISIMGPKSYEFMQFVNITQKLWLIGNTRYPVQEEAPIVYTQFESSLQATEFMQNIETQLEDERLHDWATDTSNKAIELLGDAVAAYDTFLQYMYDV